LTLNTGLAGHFRIRLEAKSNQPIRVIVDFEGQFIGTQFGLLDWHLPPIADSNEGTENPVNVLVQRQVDRHRESIALHRARPIPGHVSRQQCVDRCDCYHHE
jgi:hypothetical protein